MRRTGIVAVACLGLAATAAGQSKSNPKIDVVLTGCLQAEPRPASASGRPVLIVTNASVTPDTSSAAGSPAASGAPRLVLKDTGVGTTFILQGGKDDLPDYLGKRVEIRASIDQAAQRAPAATGTSGSGNPPEVKSEGWPRALVKEIHSIGNCEK